MRLKLAKNLKINDVFMDNELNGWRTMEDASKDTGSTIKVKAYNTGSMKIKVFEFGNMEKLYIIKLCIKNKRNKAPYPYYY